MAVGVIDEDRDTDETARTGGPEATKSIMRARGASGVAFGSLSETRLVVWRCGLSPPSRRATRSAIALA
jgi:hypothetical protein